MKQASNSSPGEMGHHPNLPNLYLKGLMLFDLHGYRLTHFLMDNPLDGFPSGRYTTAAEYGVSLPVPFCSEGGRSTAQ